MVAWTERVRRIWERPKRPGIELGNGRMMEAEDVLEGHYQRVTAQRPQPNRGGKRVHQVEVQVGDNLMAAIAVLAPELAPLTEVAEDVSMTLPHVQPAPQFRRNLQAALEQTHRQHAAQRQLGTRHTAPKSNTQQWWPGLLAAGLLMAVLWLLWRSGRKR